MTVHICEAELSVVYGKSDEGRLSEDLMRCLDGSNQQEVMLTEELDGAIKTYALKIDNLYACRFCRR